MLTTEIEHINADAVETAARDNGLEMEPTPHTIRIIQVHRARRGWENEQPARAGSCHHGEIQFKGT